MSEALVGRQPIYDRELEVYGYELLFRRTFEETAQFDDGDSATSRVIQSAFHTIGMRDVVGDRRAFVNLTRGFIVGEFELPVPTEGVVLEVLEHIEPDAEVLAGLRSLTARGYTIALDDFVLNDRTKTMLDFATLVKLDIVELGWDAVEAQVKLLRERDLTLIAEQVRTLEDFERCRSLGFDLYQGYFLSKPYVVRGRRMNQSRLDVVEGLTEWLDSEQEPAAALERNPKLGKWWSSLRELDLLDSSSEDPLVAAEELRELAVSLILCEMEDRPRDLFVSALFRARMCKNLGAALESKTLHTFYLTGLLSTLGSLLECSLARIIEDLPLENDVHFALTSRNSTEGEVLACVLAYERGDWENVQLREVPSDEIRSAYLNALHWAEAVELSLHQLSN